MAAAPTGRRRRPRSLRGVQTVACTLTPLRLAYAGTESLWAELTVAGWAAAVWQQPDGFVFQVGNDEQLPTTDLSDSLAPTQPRVAITTAPGALTNSTSAHFAIVGQGDEERDVTYSCSLDGKPVTICSTAIGYTSLAAGAHTFTVTGHQAGSRPSNPVRYKWFIDRTAPSVKVPAVASRISLHANPRLRLSGRDDQPGLRYNLRFRTSTRGHAFGHWEEPDKLRLPGRVSP